MIDITPADQEIVTAILKKYVPHAEVRVFGSRHKWTAKPYSDLDLAIVADAKLDKQLIYDLEEAFEESELSFRVDVIDWFAISDEFRAIIEQGYTVIQEKTRTLPAGWVVKKLGDVIQMTTGKLNANKAEEHGIYPFFTCAPQPYKINKFAFDCDAVLLAGNNANGTFHVNRYNGKFNAYQRTYVITALEYSSIDFIYYKLKNIISDFVGTSQGSATKFLTKPLIENTIIELPPLDKQKEIAAILSSLDDKIERNQQINKKLEEMAQAIFKEWFIDFNFPDENGNPYRDSGGAMTDSELGLIPASWSVGKLGEEFNITMGQSPVGSSYNESKEGMIFFQGRTDFGTRFPSIRLFTTEPKRIAKKFDILLSVRAPVGDINIALQDCCIGRGLAAINAENKSYCYYKLQFLQQQFNIYNGTGTVFGAINKDQLHGLSVVIAAQNVVRNFEDVVSKIDEKIYHNHLEILNLQNTRDTLLPKLISGELIL
ncbi:restriction endonuclease subunit S [Aquella oligotrophica]|uniref:Restriction endonuclease subunit S n=1 Tax=Aquella oligotrophica TaxID=2067065 RepID=A0A2I7N7C0_9NEIS|nr:restriction endonuclease subunit S [Aquella oligotrophica]AUR52354.1 restriction endonuclease subunit S [Aquella oligotrophica]